MGFESTLTPTKWDLQQEVVTNILHEITHDDFKELLQEYDSASCLVRLYESGQKLPGYTKSSLEEELERQTQAEVKLRLHLGLMLDSAARRLSEAGLIMQEQFTEEPINN